MTENVRELIAYEMTQRQEAGFDVSWIRQRLAGASEEQVSALWQEMNQEPLESPHEPSSLEAIQRLRPQGPRQIPLTLSREQLLNRIYGAWLGRAAGCLLGKPVEGWTREQIEAFLTQAQASLDDYIPYCPEIPGAPTDKSSCRGHITHMVRDDDMDYPILGLHILQTHGFDFTPQHVGDAWLGLLPYHLVYTAEKVAYRNFVNGLKAPVTAWKENPFREWIGAQIRADIWGYVAPGQPEYAACLAFKDACISHTANGIYGELFVAAMIAAAFTTDSIREVIAIGLSEIPAQSRLAQAVHKVLEWHETYPTWQEAWQAVMNEYGHYHRVHTINNCCFVLLGLLYGEKDFGKTIAIAVQSGLDTDCNGATAGSILGVMLGARALPAKWILPLHDRLDSIVVGYTSTPISQLAERTLRLAERA